MLKEGKVDKIGLVPRFAPEPMAAGKYRAMFTAAEVHGTSEPVFWCVRADFIAAQRRAPIDFFIDDTRAMRRFLDPAIRDEALAILVAVTRNPLEDVEFASVPPDLYRSPDVMPDTSVVQHRIDEHLKLGVLPVSAKCANLTLITAAKERLYGHGA